MDRSAKQEEPKKWGYQDVSVSVSVVVGLCLCLVCVSAPVCLCLYVYAGLSVCLSMRFCPWGCAYYVRDASMSGRAPAPAFQALPPPL